MTEPHERMSDYLLHWPLARRGRRVGAMRLGIGVGGVLILALLWSGVWFHLRTIRADRIAEAQNTAANLARAFEEHIVRTIKGVDQALLQMRAAYAADPHSFDFDPVMHGDEVLADLVVGMTLIGPDGRLVWSTSGVQPGLYLGDREHFRFHADGNPDTIYISKPVLSRATSRMLVQVTRRVTMTNGSFGGVAVISLDPGYLADFYKSIDIGPGGGVVVMGTDGFLRAQPTAGPLEVGRDLRDSSLMRAQARQPIGVVQATSSFDGVTRTIAYRTLQTLPLIVAVSITEADALAQYYHQRSALLIAGSALTLLFGALGLLLMRQAATQARVEIALRRAKEEAEAANVAKSEFLANVSHELRTPLNAVIGFSEIMRDALMGPIDNRYREYAQDIHDSGQHLLRLIGDVLDLSKIGAGRLDLHDEPVDLGQILASAQRLLGERARNGGVILDIDRARDLPIVLGDPVRLKQIVLNLMSNAVKFTPEGGRVGVRAAPDGDGGVVVTVTDTGIGMTSAEIDVALEPFRQVDNAMSRRYEGTGLGLPLAKQLTELHAGTLDIVSQPGVGTTVRMRLPRNRVLTQPDLLSSARLVAQAGRERD